MLLSIALMLILGFALSGLFNRLKIPGLIAMILTGIVLGPYVLDLISDSILDISKELRQIALIVILARAGLSLDISDLKKVGRPAVLMCFVPASFEMAAVTLLAPLFLKVSYLDAAIMGAILAAVSPAVVVPRMLFLMENGYGKSRSIPQLIMAGASVDDIYVIVVFTALIGMSQGNGLNAGSLITIPISIILGLLLGIISGIVLVLCFKKLHIRDTIKVMLILSISFLMVTLEAALKPYLPISGLLAVMALCATLLKQYQPLALRLKDKFSKIWVGAEVMLFILVGAAVDIRYLANAGIMAVLLILSVLLVRMLGVYVSLIKTKLTPKERLFCALSYLPKATVQAAIGSIPLSLGISSGETILAVAVAAILITAPLGALLMDHTYLALLKRSE